MSKVAKYGKFVHLKKVFQGTWRVSPATTYLRADLTAANEIRNSRKTT